MTVYCSIQLIYTLYVYTHTHILVSGSECQTYITINCVVDVLFLRSRKKPCSNLIYMLFEVKTFTVYCTKEWRGDVTEFKMEFRTPHTKLTSVFMCVDVCVCACVFLLLFYFFLPYTRPTKHETTEPTMACLILLFFGL